MMMMMMMVMMMMMMMVMMILATCQWKGLHLFLSLLTSNLGKFKIYHIHDPPPSTNPNLNQSNSTHPEAFFHQNPKKKTQQSALHLAPQLYDTTPRLLWNLPLPQRFLRQHKTPGGSHVHRHPLGNSGGITPRITTPSFRGDIGNWGGFSKRGDFQFQGTRRNEWVGIM